MTVVWERILGQKEAVKNLKAALKNKSYSHAYLFFGPEGVGKKTMAFAFAMTLNCPEGGCGICPSCTKVEALSHPDFFYLEPEGNFITLEQIKEVRHRAALKSMENDIKVFIIDEADKMTPEAANALLKVLEEPPPNLVFILLTTNLKGVLPTIISRCQPIIFKAISYADIIKWLTDEFKISHEKAELVTRLSGGILEKALAYATEDSHFQRRTFVLEIARDISNLNDFELAKTAEKLVTMVKTSLKEFKNSHEKDFKEIEEYALTRQHASHIKKVFTQRQKRKLDRTEHESFNEIFDTLSSWYRDLYVLIETKSGALIINQDKEEELKKMAEKISSESTRKAVKIVRKTQGLLRYNVNMQLAFEVMLFNLKEVC